MNIAGVQNLSLLDYPGKVSCIIFTSGCNFSCCYCQNSILVGANEPLIHEEDIFDFLKDRYGKLEGVVISGGEPTCQKDLVDFIKAVKELGYAVKLDTNGSNPQIVKRLMQNNLLDYLAVDIKSDEAGYPGITRSNASFQNAKQCIELAEKYGVDYEARTTVIYQYHTPSTFYRIGKELRDCKKYYLQPFKDSKNVPCHELTAPPKEEMQLYQTILSKYVKMVEIRGE